MTVRAMTEPQILRFSKSMESQGVVVTRTKKGLLLRLPDKTTAMIHFTTSDRNADKIVKARLRRSGVNHPDDNKAVTLPSYITSGTVRQQSKENFYQWVRKHEYPMEVYGRDLVTDLNMDAGQVNRVLFHAGFVPQKGLTKKGRAWQTPDWLLDEAIKKVTEDEQTVMDNPVPDDVRELIEGAHAAQVEINQIIAEATADHEEAIETEVPEPEPIEFDPPLTEQESDAFTEAVSRETSEPEPETEKVSFSNGRELIDTYDSWQVDMRDLLGEHLDRMVRERLSVLGAVGIEYEVRVWRKK